MSRIADEHAARFNVKENEHAARARAVKVAKMVAYFDRILKREPAMTNGEIALLLSLASVDAWKRSAKLAGVNMPSQETRNNIVEVYRDRQRYTTDPFAGI